MQFYDGFIGHNQSDTLNSYGHRCKELADVDLHNYILFAGDHASVDFDTELEKTFPYLVAKEMRCDYYNLSVSDGGIDAIKTNLIAWYSKIQQKPKAVIIGYQFLNIFLASDKNYSFFQSVDYRKDVVNELIVNSDKFNYFKTKHILFDRLLANLPVGPLYQVMFDDNFPPFSSSIKTTTGTSDHAQTAKNIVSIVAESKKNIKP